MEGAELASFHAQQFNGQNKSCCKDDNSVDSTQIKYFGHDFTFQFIIKLQLKLFLGGEIKASGHYNDALLAHQVSYHCIFSLHYWNRVYDNLYHT